MVELRTPSSAIFATVSALLMLLIGGICAFLLPIAQYPQIAPPQVQVTTTYTGADASSVARTVTTPIEQQINGTKGLIYYSSDSTSNGVSNIVATFDVGFSQDLAAVDIQNKVQTAQAQLPPEVKQYGVTIKESSKPTPVCASSTSSRPTAAMTPRFSTITDRSMWPTS